MKIRPAVDSDIHNLVEAQGEMAWETEKIRLDEKVLETGIRAVLSDSAKGRYFVAEDRGAFVGCFMLTPEWSDWRNAYMIWLQSVYIVAHFRKSGVFREMYEYLKSIVSENEYYAGIRLYVSKDNANAIKVYQKLGMSNAHHEMFEWMQANPDE